ncbi:hypothetical protein OX284_012335 [Flavobacterium sp. SUN046]|uniref:hypothetical protein n=1 Tax=Flavobacterium sp. SUN046 TaxID=3002440 RepID=UPI002DB9AFCB|nr:hypothetical protein [Flavobacterium sp. SUN046]MEC4050222.1 hypothetical protein [Flavobacterium sp. SUN046]
MATTKDSPCDIFDDYPSGGTTAQQLDWLKDTFPIAVDPIYYCCISNFHSIQDSEFQTYLNDYLKATNNLAATLIPINSIRKLYKDLNINYDNFISFECDDRLGVISAKLTSNFLTDLSNDIAPTSYSLPLIESIYSEFGSVDLIFAKVIIKEQVQLAFFVKGCKEGYMDFSQNPL